MKNFFLITFLLGMGVVGWGQSKADVPSQMEWKEESALLSQDEGLRKNIEFWIKIYTRYNNRQGLIHDAKYIDKIYEVIDHNPKSRRKYWREILLLVHQKQAHPETLSGDEKKVYDLYQDIDEPNKFLNAAHRKRLRFQLGQRNHFLRGLIESGRYLAAMEKIFAEEGVPVAFTRLPFVESSFNVRARSKVGASGIWQFMNYTAKLFCRVDEQVDERNDPLKASRAAAKLLRMNYNSLKQWSLAVTAYNHGRKGMMRAVRRVGYEDLDRVIADYHQRAFGFASRNFYAELLAVIEIEKNAEQYFGKLNRLQPIDFMEFQVQRPVYAKKIAQKEGIKWSEFKELNPALTEAVLSGELPIPARYPLRMKTSQNQRAQH